MVISLAPTVAVKRNIENVIEDDSRTIDANYGGPNQK